MSIDSHEKGERPKPKNRQLPGLLALLLLLLLVSAFPAFYGDRFVTVSGQVVDENGEAVPGANVTLHAEPDARPVETTADASGEFSLMDAAAPTPFRKPPDAILRVEKDGYLPHEERFDSTAVPQRTVVLKTAEPLRNDAR